jgi:hypothetical protein
MVDTEEETHDVNNMWLTLKKPKKNKK